MFGLSRTLHEALPALQTAIAITLGACASVAVLAAGVIAAWSIGLYFWLSETMTAPQAAFTVGGVLLVLCIVTAFAARIAIRKGLSAQAAPAPRRKHDALASALEAIGDVAESRPLPALLSALVLGLAAGYLDDNGSAPRPR